MKRIHEITHIEEKVDKNGEPYFKTYAVMEDGTEAEAFSKNRDEFKVNDPCEVFLHFQYDTIKFRHSPKSNLDKSKNIE